jgi:effector-associated domain 1 (EAD1)-containing protein
MDGRQMRRLCDALCEAFNENSLTRLIRFHLDKDLARLVSPGDFNTVVFKLTDLASREGWLGDLIIAAGEERPSSLALESLRSELQVAKVKQEQERQGRELEWIKLLIDLVISKYERTHLCALAADGPFMAEVKTGSTFEWELRHLITLQLVDRHPNRGIRSLFARPGRTDIKEHLFITDRGRAYLRVFDEAHS